jgi:hypothetical protein
MSWIVFRQCWEDEMVIRKSDKRIRITKLVGADLPLETEKERSRSSGFEC